MAINSIEKFHEKPPLKSTDINIWRGIGSAKNHGSCNESEVSGISRHSKQDSKNSVSPYLAKDKFKVTSKVTEKKIVQGIATGYVSSFPLAASIYKANSDEKVPKRSKKKSQKALLPSPDDVSAKAQICTVSDMNESDYNETKITRKPKPKKRRINQNKKSRYPPKGIEIYDRDAKYCSQLNIDLDCSSTDMFKHLTGDGNGFFGKHRKRNCTKSEHPPNNVWAVLRNMNRFQFIPSAPMSVESCVSGKNSKSTKNGRNLKKNKDTRLFETSCRTEEFAYISFDNVTPSSYSRSSSFDRVTVIDKQDDFIETCIKGIENVEITQKRCNTNDIRPINNKRKNIANHNKQIKSKDKKELSCEKYSDSGLDSENNIDIVSDFNKLNMALNNNFYEQEHADNWNDKIQTSTKINKKVSKLSVMDAQGQGNGFTKVNFVNTKNNDNLHKTRQPRLVTTIPTRLVPKLTQADIKRRLCNLRFPITILGNDQISSSIEVNNEPFSQFMGLEKQIWPYMVKWIPQRSKKGDDPNVNRKITEIPQKRKNVNNYGINKRKILLVEGDTSKQKSIHLDNLNSIDFQSKKNKTRHDTSPVDVKTESPKLGHMHQFKEKMINLFNKKSPNKTRDSRDTRVNSRKALSKTQGVSTEIQTNLHTSETKVSTSDERLSVSAKMMFQWSKAKWASDFIENVIRKIKSGTYYNHEILYKRISDVKTKFTQTENNNDIKNIPLKALKVYFDDELEVIPGFEDNGCNLEVETINKNQITIKNCVTNILIQFDVTLPYNDLGTSLEKESSMSCIPLGVRESRTKIFKYKASITNDTLPAELCRIFPNVLRNMLNSNATSQIETGTASSDVILSRPCQNICKFYLFHNVMSPAVTILGYGRFSDVLSKFTSRIIEENKHCTIVKSEITFENRLLSKLREPSCLFNDLSNLNNARFCLFKINQAAHIPEVTKVDQVDKVQSMHYSTEIITNNNKCRILIPYHNAQYQDNRVGYRDSHQNQMLCVVNTLTNKPIQSNSFLNTLKLFDLNLNGDTVTEREYHINNNALQLIVQLNVNNIVLDNHNNLDDHRAKSITNGDQHSCELIKSCTGSKKHKPIKTYKAQNNPITKMYRKKSFTKLCKKCKSTSCISRFKKTVSLQKIANLDEFFQAFGLAKDLCNVVNGNVERKILSSIIEMKTWLNEISPRQALLIFLFSNKKETPNVIRHRNVIIQGIATNRITQASDLEMELEVIERENLKKIHQYEGITYLPKENQDILFDELCWIAKNTASANNREFDEASQQLLRSLLLKRKKLNPSYLRVMARYVGLGLLKS